MKLIRSLLFPWILFFSATVVTILIAGLHFHTNIQQSPLATFYLGVGACFCVIANIITLNRVGIWMADALPNSLTYGSWRWFMRALFGVLVAAVIYWAGQFSWMPLFWQGLVQPAALTLVLFWVVSNLMGPVLRWSSSVAFSNTFSIVLSLPVFAMIPIAAIFMGETVLNAYQASQPDLLVIHNRAPSSVNAKDTAKEKAKTEPEEKKLSQRAEQFQALAESGKPCGEDTKEITNALTTNGPEDVVYWAVKAVSCAEMKAVIGLPKLADIMMKHPNPKVRAAAIRAMPKFGTENVKRIGYLLVKRIGEKEPTEVIEAAAKVLPALGEDEAKWTSTRLKGLLDAPHASETAARVLIEKLKREDLVADYVSEHLGSSGESRARAVSMICLLPKNARTAAETHIADVVASIQSGARDDSAMKALGCLGEPGFQAVRQEVVQPQRLEKTVAARALAEMDVTTAPTEALETATNCSQDQNPEVRKWCSQSLGKMGAPALPKILDLLRSNDSELKDAGKNALNHFEDENAKEELQRVRAENSGWMANRRKLQIAEAVSTALVRIETEEKTEAPATTK